MRARWIDPGLLLGLVLLLPAATVATDPLPVEPGDWGGPADETDSRLWLKGSFGTVPGGPLHDPATAPPDGAPLDTWMRSAILELASEVSFEELEVVSITSRAASGDGPPVEHALTDRWFEGPDTPGLHVLTVRVQAPSAGTREQAWLLNVPDREGSWQTLLEMPALEAELRSRAGTVLGERGHGCYVGGCQEVGLRPPPDTLVPLTVAVGETPRLHLSDGSALQHWQGQLRPLPGTMAEDRIAAASFPDVPVTDPDLAGLEPAVAGEWLLEVRVDFDRDRGWQWYLYRLVTP